MSSDSSVFTGENLNDYLKAVAKEYKKMGGKAMPAELILIGGAAVIANYGFREMTTDIDAIIHAASVMKDAINSVGDQYHLQNGWLNTDFMRTASYSPKLDQYSTYYRTFGGILSVRTVQAEYLIAMKLRSGRFESKYPGATTSENVERIITDFKKKQKRNQTLNWLKNQKQENAQDIEADDELDQ